MLLMALGRCIIFFLGLTLLLFATLEVVPAIAYLWETDDRGEAILFGALTAMIFAIASGAFVLAFS